MITATNEVVQNPEAVGTLWKTMSARIRGAKTELEELGEEEDDFTKTTSKLRDLVKSLTGFDIMEDEETFKDIYEIILGIGKEWDKLTDIERASLGEALAGKRNANALYAVLGNLDTLQEAYQKAEDSAGSAAKEQENYAQSVQYSIDRFKASIEELSYDFLNSDFLKGIVEFGNAIIRILDAIVEDKTALVLLSTVLGGTAFSKSAKIFGSGLQELETFLDKLIALDKTVSGAVQSFESLSAATDLYTTSTELLDVALAEEVVAEGAAATASEITEGEFVQLGLANDFVAESAVTATGTLEGETVAIAEVGAAAKTSSKGMTGIFSKLGALAKAHPIATAVTVVGTIIVGVYKKTKQANEEVQKLAKSLGSEFKTAQKDIESYKKEISELQDVLQNDQSSYQESKTAREKLLSIQDELISKYGKERESISLITSAIDGEIKALDKLTEKQWAQKKAEFNTDSVWEQLNRWANGVWDGNNTDLMLKKMEEYKASLYGDEDELKKWAKEFDGVFTNMAYSTLSFSGNIDDVKEKLLDLKETINNSDNPNKQTLYDIDRELRAIQELEDSYREYYDQYVWQERIFSKDADPEYNKTFESLEAAYDKYADARDRNDEQSAERYKQEMLDTYSALYNHIMEDGEIDTEELSVWKALSGIIPEFQAELDKHVFTVYLQTDDEKVQEDIDRIENAIMQFGSEEELFAYGAIDSEDNPLHNFYEEIMTYCNLHNIQIEDLIAAYKELNRLEGLAARDVQGQTDRFERINNISTYDDRGNKTRNVDYVNALSNLSDADYDVYQVLSDKDLENIYTEMLRTKELYGDTISEADAYESAIQKIIDAKKKEYAASQEVAKLDLKTFSEQTSKLDALQSLYNSFRDNVNNNEAKINLDISDVEALRETFGDLEGFDEFELTITSDTSSVDDIQEAFDKMLTAYANANIDLKGLNQENKDMVRTQLEMAGATKESAEAYVEAKLLEAEANRAVAESGLELNEITGININTLIRLGEVTPEVGQQIALLALKEQLVNNNSIDSSSSVANLISLGRVAGADINILRALAEVQAAISKAEITLSDDSASTKAKMQAQKDLEYYSWYAGELGNRMTKGLEAATSGLDYGPGNKNAGDAGKEAADAYVEAYEKELKELQALRDQGLISEKEYLDRLKALIDKFFKDRTEYAEKYAEEMRTYLEGMKSLYDSALSGVTTLLDHKISSTEKMKESAISALEEEKEAALARYQAEIDAIDDQIKAKEKEKEALQDQIDAIEKANAARDRAINLQKAEYELQRSMNQRTKLVNIYARTYSNVWGYKIA